MINSNEIMQRNEDMVVIATAYDKTCGPQIIDMAKVPFSKDGDETSYLDWLNDKHTFAVVQSNGGREIRPVTVRVSDDPSRGPIICLGEDTWELSTHRGKLLVRREQWENAEVSLQNWINADRQRRLAAPRADESGPNGRVPEIKLPNTSDIFGYYRSMKRFKYLNTLGPKFGRRAGKINFILPQSLKP